MELELEVLTEKVIGAAIAVHKELGPGFLESIYENALKVQLDEMGVDVEFQKEIPIRYHGVLVGTHRLDALASGELIIELKAIKALEDIHYTGCQKRLLKCRAWKRRVQGVTREWMNILDRGITPEPGFPRRYLNSYARAAARVPFPQLSHFRKNFWQSVYAQVRSYIRAAELKHGLLLNFATMPLTIKRVIAPAFTNPQTHEIELS